GADTPQFLAVQVEAGEHDPGLLEERDPETLAVGDGGGAGVAVEVVLLLQRRRDNDPPPQLLAAAPVQAQEHALPLLLQRGREKDLVAPDHRRRVALARDGDFPRDVVGVAPAGGDVGFVGVPVAMRPAPAGPLAGAGASRGQQDGEDGRRANHHAGAFTRPNRSRRGPAGRAAPWGWEWTSSSRPAAARSRRW